MTLRTKSLLLAGCVSLAAVGTASAGGFDRGGVNIDLLFDPSRIATEAAVTYVSPQRTIENVTRGPAAPLPPIAPTASIDVDSDYVVPRFSAKMNLFEPVDCLGSYTEPYGVDAYYGYNNAHSPTSVAFGVSTRDVSLTCSYKMDMGKGTARIIGGVSYQQVEAFLARQTLLAAGNPGVGRFNLTDEAFSWRIGAAYEIPEIALRASLMYSAKYDYDDLSGLVDTTGFAGGPFANIVPGSTGIYPVSAKSETPQALEFKIQSGIAPGWLAFASVKWQQWSKLGIIPIQGVRSPATGAISNVSFDPLYRDGWTVSGGIGHKFTDQISGAASITWDRGTSTTTGTQTDTWTFGVGGSYTPQENVELRLGGVIGILTSGSSTPSGGDPANNITYNFGNDVVYGGTAALKVKF